MRRRWATAFRRTSSEGLRQVRLAENEVLHFGNRHTVHYFVSKLMGNIKHPGRHRARIASSGTEKANISQIMLELCLLD